MVDCLTVTLDGEIEPFLVRFKILYWRKVLTAFGSVEDARRGQFIKKKLPKDMWATRNAGRAAPIKLYRTHANCMYRTAAVRLVREFPLVFTWDEGRSRLSCLPAQQITC